jgi:hypothetical protein
MRSVTIVATSRNLTKKTERISQVMNAASGLPASGALCGRKLKAKMPARPTAPR